MLCVPAFQVRHPVTLFVLMKPDNHSFVHACPLSGIASQPFHCLQNSYGSPNVNNEEPAATATYCFPSIAYVIGDE